MDPNDIEKYKKEVAQKQMREQGKINKLFNVHLVDLFFFHLNLKFKIEFEKK